MLQQGLPSNLSCVNQIWRTEYADEVYGLLYKIINPTTYAEHKLGLITTTATLNQFIYDNRRIKIRPTAADDTRYELDPCFWTMLATYTPTAPYPDPFLRCPQMAPVVQALRPST